MDSWTFRYLKLQKPSLRVGYPSARGQTVGIKSLAGHLRPLVIAFENWFEATIFWARWLLAPAYVVLVLCLFVLTYKTFEEFAQLILNLRVFDEARAVLQILIIVDLVLVMNLVLLIIFVGYVNFVSKIDVKGKRKEHDWPDWMDAIDYSGLKVQLLGSVIAIASIKMLRAFIEIFDVDDVEVQKIVWTCVLYMCFLFAVLIVAMVNRIKPHPTEAKSSALSRGADERADSAG
jgi:uncharacterized protein (TIGR00645 family)